ncbi:hypothetical protein CVT24_002427 [Panaeolus cyanescens]|uniref:Uncharacterized protein n=1 Tax=Panaeolus cyanescens TaxID=181874 RepID=A0A409X039_9AGAR|nr:hypothetical protein CVT24_002427 [Panaeolus cyanescens]
MTKTDPTGDYKFEKASPTIFNEGDLVEVQVSFAMLPLKDKKAKLSLILRSISMLDNKFRQEATVRRFQQKKKITAGSAIVVKRKVGYHDEHVSTARAKMELSMEIDDEKEE